MPGYFDALAGGLAAALSAWSLGVWATVIPLAGGPHGPVWRWVLVEEGLFLLLLAVGSWWVRVTLGLGQLRRTPQHYGVASVFATIFSLLWCWYGLTLTAAMAAGMHPIAGWEWAFFTWGLPMTLAAAIVAPGAGLVVHLGVALTLGAAALMALGRVWAGR